MAINNGDFVKVNFTGKIKENGEVFDTTYENVATEEGFDTNSRNYQPIPIVVGAHHLLPAIEEEIEGLDEGDEKTIEIACEDAFGKRNSDNVQLIPMKEFKKQGMNPVPGMPINVGDKTGKILTVNGGRVRVDFNHELAGKDLVYDIEIVKILDDDEDKVRSMLELHNTNSNTKIDDINIEFDGDIVNITLDELSKFDQKSYMDVSLERFKIAKDICDNMDYDKVNFIDSFEINSEENNVEDKE